MSHELLSHDESESESALLLLLSRAPEALWRNTRIKKKLLLLVTGVHAPSFFFAKKKTAAAGSRPTPLVPVVVNCGGHRVTARTPPRRLGPLPAAATSSALGLQDGCG